VAVTFSEETMKKTIVAAALLLAGMGWAQAQVYPSRPVTLIVPYPAGGPTDQLARVVAPKFSAELARPGRHVASVVDSTRHAESQ
jgi:tripartite-type tricarboxylate transporter receptor subunit TctC